MVDEPATDGDSDHTDSGATVDSNNTCELAVTVTRCYFLVLQIISMLHLVLKMWEWACMGTIGTRNFAGKMADGVAIRSNVKTTCV